MTTPTESDVKRASVAGVEMTKVCSKCKKRLPLKSFHKSIYHRLGRCAWCGKCFSAYSKIDKAKNRERISAKHSAWYRNGGKEIVRKNVKIYRKKHQPWKKLPKIQRQAYAKLQNAKRRGFIIPQPCEVCGSVKQVEAHHKDYSKPLEVNWLCHIHHKLTHGRPILQQSRDSKPSLQKLSEVYDLEDMTCEKHPDKPFPHKWLIGECIGPGIPRKRYSKPRVSRQAIEEEISSIITKHQEDGNAVSESSDLINWLTDAIVKLLEGR